MDSNKLILTRKPPKGEDGYAVFSVRVKNETVQKLDTITQETGSSRNELINIFLDYATNNYEIKD